jgi:site-specific recombinase XerD
VKKPLEFDGARKVFFRGLAVKNYAEGTVETYRRSLRYLEVYLEKIGEADLRRVTSSELRSLCEEIGRRPWAGKTRQRVVLQLKAFFEFLLREEKLLFNPMAAIPTPLPCGRKLPQILSRKEVAALLLATHRRQLGVRDRALLELLYSSGLRSREMVRLKTTNIDDQAGLVFVVEGKGGKDRVVPVGRSALFWLGKYRAELRPRLLGQRPGEEFFFNQERQTLLRASVSDGAQEICPPVRDHKEILSPSFAPHDGDSFAGKRGLSPRGAGNPGACGSGEHFGLHPIG